MLSLANGDDFVRIVSSTPDVLSCAVLLDDVGTGTPARSYVVDDYNASGNGVVLVAGPSEGRRRVLSLAVANRHKDVRPFVRITCRLNGVVSVLAAIVLEPAWALLIENGGPCQLVPDMFRTREAGVRAIVAGDNVEVAPHHGSGVVTISALGGGGGGAVSWDDITGRPDFAAVALSGDYGDLSNRPDFAGLQSQVAQLSVDLEALALDVAAQHAGRWVLLDEQTANDSSSLMFTLPSNSAYSDLEFVYNDITSTAEAGFWARVDVGGVQTSSYDSAAHGVLAAGHSEASTTAAIMLSRPTVSPTGPGLTGVSRLTNWGSASAYKRMTTLASLRRHGAGTETVKASGVWLGGTGAISALQFLMSTGNIATGRIRMFGRTA